MDEKLKNLIHREIKNAIVKIFTTVSQAKGPQFRGTGFFITTNGYLLTAYHCIGKPLPQIIVETRFEGKLVAQLDEDKSLPQLDIAVLKVEHKTNHCLPLGIVPKVQISGNEIVGFGYPAWEAKINEDIGVFPGNISRVRDDHKLEVPSAIKGQGQSGGPIYHHAHRCVIAMVSSGYTSKIIDNKRIETKMTDTGLAIPFDALFERWAKFEQINQAVAQAWEEQLVQLDTLKEISQQEIPLSASESKLIPPNPYRGLESFRKKDKDSFFGRTTDIDDLLQAVQNNTLVAVVGSSGSGKSSLVFAGLTARLSPKNWIIVNFRPQNRPFHELVQALMPELHLSEGESAKEFKTFVSGLNDGSIDLSYIVQRILKKNPDKQRLLLIIDQFEELYTLNPDQNLQHHFIDRLLEAVATFPPLSKGGETIVEFTLLLTIRADFMSYALDYGAFSVALDNHPKKILGPITDETQLRRIIEEPAHQLGVTLESDLTQRILQDVRQVDVNLPLLEFALTQLWDKQTNGQLTHVAYGTIGGVTQALSNHADDVYTRFKTKTEKEELRRIFVQLVRPGEGTEDTRQVATREQVGSKNWEKLVTQLADARLVVTGHNDETGQETVEVVHEALIRHWQPLRQWINEDRHFRVWQNDLRQAIQAWEQVKQDEDALLRGVRLAEAEEKFNQYDNALSPQEQAYIEASIAWREREIAKRKRERQEREQLQQRHNQRLKLLLAVVSVFLVVAIIEGIFGFYQMKIAQQNAIEAKELQKAAENNEEIAKQEKIRAEQQTQLAKIKSIETLHQTSKSLFVSHDGLDALLAGIKAGKMLKQTDNIPINLRNQTIFNLRQVVDDIYEKNRLDGHKQPVNSIDFSPDGKILASGSSDHTIKLWKIADGSEINTLKGHSDSVLSIDFSPNGKLLVSGSSDNTIKLWDVKNGQEIKTLTGHSKEVLSVAFSSNGETLASASSDGIIKLWNNGIETKMLKGHSEAVNSIHFSPDGKTLASGSSKGIIKLWDIINGIETKTLIGHSSAVYSIHFSLDGKTLASGSDYGIIKLWDVIKGIEINTLQRHFSVIYSVHFSPDGKTLVSGSLDRTIKLWNVINGNEVKTLEGHPDSVFSVNFSPDGRMLASGGGNYYHGTIKLWHIEGGAETNILRGHSDHIESIDFSPDGKMLISGSRDKTIKLWDIETRTEITLGEHSEGIDSVKFSPDGKIVMSGSSDNKIKLWNVEEQREIIILPKHHPNGVSSVDFNYDGTRFLLSNNNRVTLWHLENNHIGIGWTWDLETIVNDISFTPDGRMLIFGLLDGRVGLIYLYIYGKGISWFGHPASVNSVGVSPNGTLFASGSSDRTIKLWNIVGNSEIAILPGHFAEVFSVNFSPDGKMLASGSRDNTIKLWNVADNSEIITLQGHTELVSSVRFNPNGKMFLASGSWDNTIRLWDFDLDVLLKRGCAWLYDYLTTNRNVNRKDRHVCDDILDITVSLPILREHAILRGHQDVVNYATFSPDSQRIATASGYFLDSKDNTVQLWDVNTGKRLHILKGHIAPVTHVNFSPDGQRLVTASLDKTARLWHVNTGEKFATLKNDNQGIVWNATFSPNGQHVVTASLDKTTRLWNANTGKLSALLVGHGDLVRYAAFSPDGNRLVTTLGGYLSRSKGNTAHLWDAKTATRLAVLIGHEDDIYYAAFSPDGQRVVTASRDNTARLWEVPTGRPLAVLNAHDKEMSYNFKKTNTLMLSDAFMGKMLVNKSLKREYKQGVFHATFSPDSQRVVTASFDGTARLWDANTGKQLVVLEGHEHIVNHAAFSQNGQYVVTASGDHTARLWNANTGKLFAVLKGHEGSVVHAEFSSNDQYVVTASFDKTARIWYVGIK